MTSPSVKGGLSRIRLERGSLVKCADADAIVTFLTADLGWESPLNRTILEKSGGAIDGWLLENTADLKPGDAVLAPGTGLSCPNLLIGILPQWADGLESEERALRRCYRNCVHIAAQQKFSVIALPGLARQRQFIPFQRSVRIALATLAECAAEPLERVRILCLDVQVYKTYRQRLEAMGKTGSSSPGTP